MIAAAPARSVLPIAVASLSLATHPEIPAILRKLGRLRIRWELGAWTATLAERGESTVFLGRGATVLDAVASVLLARLNAAGFVA